MSARQVRRERWENGQLVAEANFTVDGHAANELELIDRVHEAIANLEQADTNWAALDAAGRAGAMRLAIRTVAKLARLAMGRLEAT